MQTYLQRNHSPRQLQKKFTQKKVDFGGFSVEEFAFKIFLSN